MPASSPFSIWLNPPHRDSHLLGNLALGQAASFTHVRQPVRPHPNQQPLLTPLDVLGAKRVEVLVTNVRPPHVAHDLPSSSAVPGRR